MIGDRDASLRRPVTGRMVLICLIAFFAVVALASTRS